MYPEQFPTTPDFTTEEGYEKVYRAYVKMLCRIAYNQLRDEAVAEGLVHNVFCSLWENRNNLQLEGPIENYLVRAVKLSVMDQIRTQARRRERLESAYANQSAGRPFTAEQVGFNELSRRVEMLVEKLPNQCREVFQLSRYRGLNNREISSSLCIAEKTVESHLSKALKFLRIHLAEFRS